MKKKIQRSALATSLLVLVLGFVALSAHAQPTVNTRTDKPAYAPGDSGTLTISIINDNGGGPLLLRNITVYYPWAGYDTNQKWLSNANFTYSLSPPVALATSGATNYTYTTPSFAIPSWWNGQTQSGIGCTNSLNRNPNRGTFAHCIFLGENSTFRNYEGFDFGVTTALAVYNPSTLSAIQEWVPVATLVVLVIATAILAMVMLRLGNLSKRQ